MSRRAHGPARSWRAVRTNLTTVAVAVLLAAAGGRLAAQETSRARARAVLPADVFAQIDAVARGAEADGIPGDILYNKALEGVAKHVPDDRLLPAVEAYAGRLRSAQGAFGGGAAGPLLVAGADAIQRGVSAHLLQRLGGGRERSPVAVLALSNLVEAGVSGDEALSLVQEAMRRGVREQQMLDMPAEVRRLMRQGQSPQDAVSRVRRGMWGGSGTPPVAPGTAPMGRRGGGGGG